MQSWRGSASPWPASSATFPGAIRGCRRPPSVWCATSWGQALYRRRLMRRSPLLLHETQTLRVNFLGIREQIPPHAGRRRQVRQRAAKGFDHQPAIIIGFPQRPKRLVPVHQPGPRRTPVVLTDVYMNETVAQTSDDFGDILFFDVGVKGIVHHAEIAVIDALHQGPGIGS